MQFNRNERELSGADLARRLDLPRASVFRMLQTLEQGGFVERAGDGASYKLGLSVLRLGFEFLASMELTEHGRPVIEGLRDATGYSAHLVVRDAREVVFIAKAAGRSALFHSIQVGARLPAHATVLGRVLMEDLTLAELRARATSQQVSLRSFGLLSGPIGTNSSTNSSTNSGADSGPARPGGPENNAWADRMRLHQALRNVLDNALRFAPPGSAIDIELDRGPDDRLHWTIKDAGPGVPDHEQAYLFEAFFHGLRNRDETGSFGLSLAIASKIMLAHGGSVWCENLPETGVAFHLQLPGGISDSTSGADREPGVAARALHHPFDA